VLAPAGLVAAVEEVVAAVPEGAAINLAGRTGVRELASAAACLPCSRKAQRRCRKSLCTDDLTVQRVRRAADA